MKTIDSALAAVEREYLRGDITKIEYKSAIGSIFRERDQRPSDVTTCRICDEQGRPLFEDEDEQEMGR
ncbi:hypothetical protein [Hyphomicrobium sp. DY-1]|uniref:hypothetical protein n=1 Tax=Hyphomicrobium sp. DY-1 TaxID=3075650 RepID=UPI0039C44668